MYKLTHFAFTVFVCDERGVRGNLVDGILQMETGELLSFPPSGSRAQQWT